MNITRLFRAGLSMRTTLGLAIGLMGLLALILALATGEVYRRLMLDSQRGALASLTQLKASESLAHVEQRSRELGRALQGEPGFRRDFAARRTAHLQRRLNSQFHQFAASDSIKLEKLILYDAAFAPIALSGEGEPAVHAGGAVCPALVDRARNRQGADRLQALSELCRWRGRPYLSVLVPIGGAPLAGYLEVISDPHYALLPIASQLGMPLKLSSVDRQPLYKSPDWPPPDQMSKALVAEYLLHADNGEPVLRIAVMNDMEALVALLARTRYLVMAIAGAITLLAVLVAFIVLDKIALVPLQNLAHQLRLVPRNRAHLGEQVAVGGINEIRELGRDFNQMTSELKRLYETLAHMALTDALTGLPNRARFYELLQQHARDPARRPFALLLMDLDRFKGVNDGLGHHVGDQLLQEVSARLEGVLRASDLVVRLDSHPAAFMDGEMIARLGGDEFAAILPGVAHEEAAATVAHKLVNAMKLPFVIDGHRFQIGMSVGATLFPQHGEDELQLMRRADAAMYHAKNNRRGFAFYEPDQEQQRLLLE